MQRLASIHQTVTSNLTGAEYDIYDLVPTAPADPILGLSLAFRADTNAQKVDLGVGAYRTDEGKPYVLEVVREVDLEVAADRSLDKEYLPIDGYAVFNKCAQELLFGADHPHVKAGNIVTVQALSGTGALRIGFEFVNKYLHAQVYVSNPTWVTHHGIIRNAGLDFVEYPYYDSKTQGLDITGMLNCLSQARYGSVILLHACAHNPTGIDPTQEQWLMIAEVMKKRHLVPLFDSAYQGYASGDVEKDAWAIRKFVEMGFQTIVTQSFAKNMGMYGERCGALHFVTSSKKNAQNVLSQVKIIIRLAYSSPPSHPAYIAGRILNDPVRKQRWLTELKFMADRIISMRALLRKELESRGVPGKWNVITDQIGMFSYTGLSPSQVDILIQKHHIYLLKNGRISMAGVNTRNVSYIANAIADAVKQTQK